MIAKTNRTLLIGLIAFVLSVVVRRIGHNNAINFASGLVTGIAIVCLLAGVYSMRHVTAQR
jgi:hypothetical protein